MDLAAAQAQTQEQAQAQALRIPFRPIFISIVFLGSFLLFLVQPLVARLALPVLGGAPSVWNTAMLFYQAALLLGYAYAHLLQRFAFRTQAICHLLLFAAATLTLPIGIRAIGGAETGDAAAVWLLKLLAVSIGPVFVAVAAQAPLMQAWFARSGDPHAASPWFLYAASNAGSLTGLLAYPFLLEPLSSLPFQQILWSSGYLLLMGLVTLGALAVLRTGARPPAVAADTATEHGSRPVTWWRRMHWLLLAAVPSGLMLSTTTHITTDIMAMPMLWVLPLSVYLISFILVFSSGGAGVTRMAVWMAPLALLLFGSAAMLAAEQSATIYGLSSLLLLLIVSTALHGTLAEDRPSASRLTEFYLWMAAGGVVGGLFPALVAPQLFDWVYEHPILLLAAALLVPAKPLGAWLSNFWAGGKRPARLFQILVVPLSLALGWWVDKLFVPGDGTWFGVAELALLAGLALVSIGRRILFTWVLAMIMLGLGGWKQMETSAAEGVRQRSFFGVYTVQNVEGANIRRLLHGTTMHGAQSLDPGSALAPLTYYVPESGVGQAMRAAPALFGPKARIGVIGLGAGTLSCYATPAEDWTMFEIDPLMVEIASDPKRFTFVSSCKPDARIVVGDARLKLADEPAARFDLLAVDAFSSDAIPLHLLTREAFDAYRHTLAPGGVLLVHISNRFLDLQPVVAAIAQAEGMAARVFSYKPSDDLRAKGHTASVWIALAADEASMRAFTQATANPAGWQNMATRPDVPAWSDDFASVLPVLKSFTGQH